MYKITVQTLTGNEHTIYVPGNEEYVVTDAVLSLSVGNAGEFNFTMPLGNPLYDEIVHNSIITVYEDNAEIWRGDIQDIKVNFDKSLNVYCLEDMAWLGEESVAMVSVTDETYLQRFTNAIASYNANQVVKRQFSLGMLTSITTTNICTWQPQYEETLLDCLRNYIADDGFVRIRREYSGGSLTRYVDIVKLSDFGVQADQKIEFGSNLLDFVKEIDNTNFLNVIYPYGKETETPLYGEIMQRMAGTPIQNDVSIAAFGRRARTVIFETDSLVRLNGLALAYLNRYSQPSMKIEVKAIDLGNIELVNRMHLGDSVRVIANTFGVDQWNYITKQDLDLLNIANNQITLAESIRTTSLTSQVAEQAKELEDMRTPESILDEAKNNALQMLEGTDGGIITFVVNSSGQIVEQRILNNLDYDQATKAWRWTLGGLSYLHRDDPTDDWTVGVAINMNGEIVADYITTGTLNAELVNVVNLDADNITSGSINADLITSGHISCDLLQGGTLDIGGSGANTAQISLTDTNDHFVGQIDKDGMVISFVGISDKTQANSTHAINGITESIDTSTSVIQIPYRPSIWGQYKDFDVTDFSLNFFAWDINGNLVTPTIAPEESKTVYFEYYNGSSWSIMGKATVIFGGQQCYFTQYGPDTTVRKNVGSENTYYRIRYLFNTSTIRITYGIRKIHMGLYIHGIRNAMLSNDFYGNFNGLFQGRAELYDDYSRKIVNPESSSFIAYSDDSNYITVYGSDVDKYENGTTYHTSWTTSDERAKNSIMPLSTKLSVNLINGTETKRFKYNGANKEHYGMIAQEVRKLLDDLGETDAALEHSMNLPKEKTGIDDQRTIDYQEYIPHLINYVKDLRAEIDSLKDTINTLKEEK